jgi:UDPglucose 6-dehydrogenase
LPPTDYDVETNFFSTASIESVVADVAVAPQAVIVIKARCPWATPKGLRQQTMPTYCLARVLREDKALHEQLYF